MNQAIENELPKAKQRVIRSIARNMAISFCYLGTLIAIWHFYVERNKVPQFLLPSPKLVLGAFSNLNASGDLFDNLRYTTGHIILGFIGGIVIGIPLGYLLWKSRIASQIFRPYIVLIQAAPKIAIAPLLILWFGLGTISQLTLIFALTFFPMMIAIILGLSSVPNELTTLGELLSMKRWRLFRKIQFPSSLPELFSGAKIAVIDAMTGAFLAEYISGDKGLGFLMVFGSSTFDSPILFAAVILTVLVGLIGFGVIVLAERALMPWRRQNS